MEQISSFLKLPIKKTKSERAELVNFFLDNLRDKKGNKFNSRHIAVKLSHLNLKDLYYFVSVFKDIQHRKGDESAQKYFWWSLKSK